MKFFAFAAIVAALVIPAPALANVTWADYSEATALRAIDSAPEVPMGLTVHTMPGIITNVGASTPFFVNFVATAPSQNGVPCFSCVNSGQSDTLGLTVPYNYAFQNSYQNYLVSWTTLDFHGMCHVAFAISAGGTVLDRFSYTFTNLGDGAFAATADRPTTGYSGAALILVKLTCSNPSRRVTSTGRASIVYQ